MRRILGLRRSEHVMSAIVCGLDVHKDSTYATVLDKNGKIVNQTRMSNERVLSCLSHFNVHRVAMESSKQVASLYRVLVNRDVAKLSANPKKTSSKGTRKVKCKWGINRRATLTTFSLGGPLFESWR
jgi:hypothetical protein